jgi:hypothetical protein
MQDERRETEGLKRPCENGSSDVATRWCRKGREWRARTIVRVTQPEGIARPLLLVAVPRVDRTRYRLDVDCACDQSILSSRPSNFHGVEIPEGAHVRPRVHQPEKWGAGRGRFEARRGAAQNGPIQVEGHQLAEGGRAGE